MAAIDAPEVRVKYKTDISGPHYERRLAKEQMQKGSLFRSNLEIGYEVRSWGRQFTVSFCNANRCTGE